MINRYKALIMLSFFLHTTVYSMEEVGKSPQKLLQTYAHFFYCCAKGSVEDLEKFFPSIDPKVRTKEHYTCLHFATKYNQSPVLNFLLHEKKEQTLPILDACSIYGKSALYLAIEGGFLDKAALLIEAGASLFSAAPEGNSLLIAAIASGNKDLIRYIIDKIKELNNQASKRLLTKKGALGLRPKEYLSIHLDPKTYNEIAPQLEVEPQIKEGSPASPLKNLLTFIGASSPTTPSFPWGKPLLALNEETEQ